MRKSRKVGARGFTLVELMVVVVLIAIIALLAVPMMRTSRDDRATFDFASQMSQLLHRASTRAMARGGAHLVLIDMAAGDQRGRAIMFEARDTDGSVRKECDRAGEWTGVAGWDFGMTLTNAPVIDGVNLNVQGIVVDANIWLSIRNGTATTDKSLAYCVTPGGKVFVGSGGDNTAAINAMQAAAPFADSFDITVQRHTGFTAQGGTAIGLARRVLAVAGAAPRVVSN